MGAVLIGRPQCVHVVRGLPPTVIGRTPAHVHRIGGLRVIVGVGNHHFEGVEPDGQGYGVSAAVGDSRAIDGYGGVRTVGGGRDGGSGHVGGHPHHVVGDIRSEPVDVLRTDHQRHQAVTRQVVVPYRHHCFAVRPGTTMSVQRPECELHRLAVVVYHVGSGRQR